MLGMSHLKVNLQGQAQEDAGRRGSSTLCFVPICPPCINAVPRKPQGTVWRHLLPTACAAARSQS